MAYAYIVTGSEDGILGVYSNPYAAYGKANDYCKSDDLFRVENTSRTNLKQHWYVTLEGKYCSATAEKFLIEKSS